MKKLAVFLLTGLVCATLLFGCGGENAAPETTPQAESSVVAEATEASIAETEVSTEESSAEIEETTQEEVSTISSFEDFVAEQIGTGIGLFVWNETTGVQERIEPGVQYQMHLEDRYFVTCRGEDGSKILGIRYSLDLPAINPEEGQEYVEVPVDTTSRQVVGILPLNADGSRGEAVSYALIPASE